MSVQFSYDPDVFVFAVRNKKKDEKIDGKLVKGWDHYCITDMTGEDRDSYLMKLTSMMDTSKIQTSEVDADGNPKIELSAVRSIEGWSTLLLSRCVRFYDKDTEDIGDLVPADVLCLWPSPLLDQLMEKANAMTGIQKKDEVAKKSSDDQNSATGIV
jgi:hypothetical protein